ncbi:MAG TPA: DUF4197 domain-containing protein [Bacteroidales bacterium]|jgi:hypothetical protein|nr:DUF4197 domain-containing protein [Bacteroidales bacterium]
MKKFVFYSFLISLVAILSCTKENGLSEEEIIQGLKEALKVGTDTSSANLHKTDGYYGDAIVKILLPPDAHGVLEHQNDPLLQAAGIDQKIEQLVLSLNRSAEDAAIEAKPIFVDAITTMSISDAASILHGTDSAATLYLKAKTRSSLFNVFIPKLQVSLNKPLVAGMSAYEAWEQLKSVYNPLCNPLTGWQPITSNLDTFATNKGLDGLFIKIAEQEKLIRHNVSYQVSDILRKVFGE